jgi:hypothetical protein
LEPLEKVIARLVKIIAAFYTAVCVLGYWHNMRLWWIFGHNYADFSEISDILIAGFKNPMFTFSNIALFCLAFFIVLKVKGYFQSSVSKMVLFTSAAIIFVSVFLIYLPGYFIVKRAVKKDYVSRSSDIVLMGASEPLKGYIASDAGDYFLIVTLSDRDHLIVRKSEVVSIKNSRES